MKNLTFYLGFATLLTHEIDAMLNHEWRVIPIIRTLADETGQLIFVAAHLPVFAILLALIASTKSSTRSKARIGICLFLIVHGLLHLFFREHSAYEFANLLSNILIFGGSALGVIYLFLEWNEKRGYAI